MPVDVMTYVKGFIAAIFGLIVIIQLIPVYATQVNETAALLDPTQAAILRATILLIIMTVILFILDAFLGK